MEWTRRFAAVAALGLAAPVVLAAAKGSPATKPAMSDAERAEFARVLHTIAKAKKTDPVMTAYARGCTLNRASKLLHRTYLRRMLKSGRAELGYYAARQLSRLDDRDGLALGVVAYVLAKRGQLTKALVPAIRAADLARDNPSINANAAQLLAWHEHRVPRQEIPPPIQATVRRLKTSAKDGKNFSPVYTKFEAEYAKVAREKQQTDSELETARSEVKELNKEIATLNRAIRDTAWLYLKELNTLTGLKGALAGVEGQIRSKPRNSPERAGLEAQRRGLQGQVNVSRGQAGRFRHQGETYARTRRQAEDKMRAKQREVSALNAKSRGLAASMLKSLKWLPPAVDGRVVAPGKLPAAPPSSAPAKPEPSAAEREAAKKLKLAELYLANKLAAKGEKLLREIVKWYPKTAAAKRAREVLEGLE